MSDPGVGVPSGSLRGAPAPHARERAGGGEAAVTVEGVSYRYGDRPALDDVSFAVGVGEILGLLGPNGGGKTTLFNLLSSQRRPQDGRLRVFGRDLDGGEPQVRRSLGVVFQSPSVDPHLTVRENMVHQGHLYSLRGAELDLRIDDLLVRFDLAERAGDRVAELSGGLRRRLEIAKALLHRPRLLLLDEPSTGLDPGIRRQLWEILETLRRESGVTVLLTTHFMEEGDRCDRVGLLDRGRIAALGAPADLRAEVGGQIVRIGTASPDEVVDRLRERFSIEAMVTGDTVRFEQEGAHQRVVELVTAMSGLVQSITVALPTLEDVFLRRTGRSLSGS